MLNRFTTNGFTQHQVTMLVDYLCQDSCTVLNLFFDWNPIYGDDYAHEIGTENQFY